MKPGDIIYPDNYQGDRLDADQDQSQPEPDLSNNQPVNPEKEIPTEPTAVPIPVPKPEPELAPAPDQPVVSTVSPPPVQRSSQPTVNISEPPEKPVAQPISQLKPKLVGLIKMFKPKEKPVSVAQDVKSEPPKPQNTEPVEIPRWTWLVIIILVAIILAGVYYLIQAK